MNEPIVLSDLDFPVICQAEVDLPEWLQQLTGKSGWQLCSEEEAEMCDAYAFRRGNEAAEIILFHTGYATVEVGDQTLFHGSLVDAHGHARMHYFNGASGEPIAVN
jgi:hypothetical protein